MMSELETAQKPSNPAVWNDPKYRALFFQAALIVGLVYFFYSVVNNTLSNMEARGISTGFAFLTEKAGFGILQSLVQFNEDSSYGRTFVVGLLNT
ncbi:MAG: general L-amino acid transport system permease protein, partial [Chitinophagales bacterium]